MNKILVRGQIKKQTEKAVLLEVIIEEMTSGEFWKKISIWLPKSQIEIGDEGVSLPFWLWRAKNEELQTRFHAGRWEISAWEAE